MSRSILLTTSHTFCAAHQLSRSDWSADKNQKEFGKCARLHGHDYRLEVCLEGTIHPETGMLINSFEAERIVGEKIITLLDHQHLNEKIPFFQDHLPTAEWIAVWVYQELKEAFPEGCRLKLVRVYETPSLYSEYAEQ